MNHSSNPSNTHTFNSRSKMLLLILLSIVFGNDAFSISKNNFCRQPRTLCSNPFLLQKHLNSRRSSVQVYSCVELNQIRNETIGDDIMESTNGEPSYKQHYSSTKPGMIVGEKQVDYVGAGTFGDIMSESSDDIEEKPSFDGFVMVVFNYLLYFQTKI